MLRHSQFKISTLFISALFLAGCVSANKKTSSVKPTTQTANRVGALPSVTSNQNIMQELTGKADPSIPTAAQLKKAPLSTQHFYAGKRAAAQKNYIIAIKQYNTVIKKYPSSKEVKPALIAKAQVYKEMGLTEPAQLNMRLAQRKNTAPLKKQMVKAQDSKKITK